jgi:hypothetical protein
VREREREAINMNPPLEAVPSERKHLIKNPMTWAKTRKIVEREREERARSNMTFDDVNYVHLDF